MGYNQDSVIKVKLLNDESIDEQVNVYRKSFGFSCSDLDIKKKWVSKHYENPNGGSLIFGAYDGERIVGINAFMPLKYSLKGKDIIVYESCESGVLPEYRGRKIFSSLINAAEKYIEEQTEACALIGFPNYRNSYPGFLKLGWKEVAKMSNYILVCNGSELFFNLTGRHFGIANIANIQQLLVRKNSRKAKYSFVDYFEDDNKNIISNKLDNGIEIKISSDFLAWKNSYKQLRGFNVYRDGSIVASFFYSSQGFRNSKMICIEKMISYCDGNELVKLYSACIRKIIKDNKDQSFIRIWALDGTSEAKVVKKLGFIKSKHPNPFIVYLLNNNVVIKDSDFNWKSLSFIDVD